MAKGRTQGVEQNPGSRGRARPAKMMAPVQPKENFMFWAEINKQNSCARAVKMTAPAVGTERSALGKSFFNAPAHPAEKEEKWTKLCALGRAKMTAPTQPNKGRKKYAKIF